MSDRRSLVILLALQLAIVAVSDPRGEFPVNDDWSFTHSVKWLLEEGRMRVSDWAAMNLLPQALGGALVARVFGFSLEALRHLTQCVALGAIAAAYACFRAMRFDAREALVATLAILAFPAWPVLASSYMSDVYGVALAWPAAALFVRALERPAATTIAAATAFAAAAVLERQVALVVPFAFLVAWLASRRPWTAKAILVGIAPFACTLAAALAYYAYLAHGPGVPEAQRTTNTRLVRMALETFTSGQQRLWELANVLTLAGYFGLFAAGWMLWSGWLLRGRARVAVSIAALATAALALAFGFTPPYLPGNVMDAAGIGPFMLYDTTREMATLARDPAIFWRVAGAIAACGGACLLFAFFAAIVRVVRDGRGADPILVFVLAILVAYLGPFVVTAYFDRYLLFALPFVLALWMRVAAAPGAARVTWHRAAGIAWTAVAMAIAAAATHDYFAWNRARWDAIHLAEGLGGTFATIDGGFEYNGLLGYEGAPREGIVGKSWYWVRDDRYVVALTAVPGYDEIRSFRVKRWLPRTPAEMKLLRRRP